MKFKVHSWRYIEEWFKEYIPEPTTVINDFLKQPFILVGRIYSDKKQFIIRRETPSVDSKGIASLAYMLAFKFFQIKGTLVSEQELQLNVAPRKWNVSILLTFFVGLSIYFVVRNGDILLVLLFHFLFYMLYRVIFRNLLYEELDSLKNEIRTILEKDLGKTSTKILKN